MTESNATHASLTPVRGYGPIVLTPAPSWTLNTPTSSFTGYPACLSSTQIPIQQSNSGSGRKRKDKENPETQPTSKKKKTVPSDLFIWEKLQYFYGFLKDKLGWTYGELLDMHEHINVCRFSRSSCGYCKEVISVENGCDAH